MKIKGFTLIELLLVIAIMGLMGTVAVGGYRAMQKGMEDRGAMQNVNQFLKSAYSRAQMERSPVLVYFWNETLQEEKSTDVLIVVGKAIAVRQTGRISGVMNNKYLYDEFGDLRFMNFQINEDGEEVAINVDDQQQGLYLYNMNLSSDSGIKRSVVSQVTEPHPINIALLSQPTGSSLAEIERYAFRIIDSGGVTWKRGDIYGLQFAELQLPDNYIFGSSYSSDEKNPIKFVDSFVYRPGDSTGSSVSDGNNKSKTVTISALRPGASGDISASQIGSSSASKE